MKKREYLKMIGVNTMRPKRVGLILAILMVGSLLAGCANEKVSTVYYPEPSDKVLSNPYMGFVPLASTKEDIYQPFSMVYAGVSWQELEPEKGIYKFDEFEKKIKFQFCNCQGQ